MAVQLIRRVRRLSRPLRQQVAFFTAAIFTLGIFGVWLTTFMATTASDSNGMATDEEANAPFATLFSSAREGFSEVMERHDYVSVRSTSSQLAEVFNIQTNARATGTSTSSSTNQFGSGFTFASSSPLTSTTSTNVTTSTTTVAPTTTSTTATQAPRPAHESTTSPDAPRTVQIVPVTTASTGSRQGTAE